LDKNQLKRPGEERDGGALLHRIWGKGKSEFALREEGIDSFKTCLNNRDDPGAKPDPTS